MRNFQEAEIARLRPDCKHGRADSNRDGGVEVVDVRQCLRGDRRTHSDNKNFERIARQNGGAYAYNQAQHGVERVRFGAIPKRMDSDGGKARAGE